MSIPHHNFGDVPLKHAMVAWNCARSGDPRIAVIPHPDMDGWTDHLKLTSTTGACWTAWEKWTKAQRLAKLYVEVWHIVCRDGVDPKAVHEALLAIPEYRDSLSGETFFWTPKGGQK